jgi:hypothetical protein
MLIFFAIPGLAHEFGYPQQGEGWYYVLASFSNNGQLEKGKWNVAEVRVNGERVRDFLVFQAKKEVFDKKIDSQSPFELKVRLSWEREKEYEIKAELQNEETGKSVSFQERVKSPAQKGYWDSGWKNYLSLIISEENGFQRTNYPVQATVGILSKYFNSPDEIRVVKAEMKGNDISCTEIPHQVYDLIRWEDKKLLSTEERDEKTGKLITRYHPTTTLSIAFLANLKPYEKATYIVFYNNPAAKKASFKTDLRVKGKGLAKTIENSFYKVTLHPKSGMIYEIYEKETGIKLEHKLETNGAVHWNPDAYSPPHAWSHCSDWENPAFSEEAGPVFYRLTRSAPLPHLKDVVASITYYFYKDSPLIIIESIMEIKNDFFLKSLRSAEVVFNKKVFNKAAYKTMEGKVEVIDFAHSRMHPKHVITLRPETPWISFFSQEKNIAFSSLFLELSTSNLNGGEASLQQPYIYIQHGPWYYLSRAFVYSFGSNNQTRMLPVRKGSIYYDKNAWMAFSLKKGDYASKNDSYFNMLKYPLSIFEEMETYPESPEGWLVPILTEPFEEGVKQAIGGKKKK